MVFSVALNAGACIKVLFAQCDDDNALAVLADIEGQRAKGNTYALLAYAQESANTDDDGADLALAVEDEIIDVANGLACRVVNGLADKYPGEPLVAGCWVTNGTVARDDPAAWANAGPVSGAAANARAPANLMI